MLQACVKQPVFYQIRKSERIQVKMIPTTPMMPVIAD